MDYSWSVNNNYNFRATKNLQTQKILTLDSIHNHLQCSDRIGITKYLLRNNSIPRMLQSFGAGQNTIQNKMKRIIEMFQEFPQVLKDIYGEGKEKHLIIGLLSVPMTIVLMLILFPLIIMLILILKPIDFLCGNNF